MCGIIAVLSLDKTKNLEILINGLKQLQNRGYDSAGIVFLNNTITILKQIRNKEFDSIDYLANNFNNDYLSNIGLAHTRWATHGGVNLKNCHPHISFDNKFSLVHNGIIENYQELKNMLIKQDITFYSETDTEVIVNLIAYQYQKTSNIEDAIKESIKMLKGTWGLAIISQDTPNKLYFIRNGSPILFAQTEHKFVLTSEKSGFNGEFKNYIVLDNHDLGIVSLENNNIIVKTEKTYQINEINYDNFDLTPDPYPHWTLKEINEQVESSLRAINNGGRIKNGEEVKLGGLEKYKVKLSDIDNVILLGCGTSLNACNYVRQHFLQLNNFCQVSCYDGAEFSSHDIPPKGNTVLILVSQSGETKDLHRCIEIGQENNCLLLGVVNVVDSMIAREVDCGVYTNSGREVGVASTKSFMNQVIVLILIAIYFSQIKNIKRNIRQKYINSLRQLPSQIEQVINNSNKELLEKLWEAKSMFILGKNSSKHIANEGALKIKELCYLHAEGYEGSALKHGPFALLEKNTPVILLIQKDNFQEKMLNVYHEVSSRDSPILVISDDNILDGNIITTYNKYFSDLLQVIPLQLMSYYISIKKGNDCDKPRNLAKCVNVE